MHSLLRNSLFVVTSYAVSAASFLPPAHACSIAAPTEHLLDPEEEAMDTTPPGAPRLGLAEIVRRPDVPGCSDHASCAGSGTLGIFVESATDDRTPGAEMGYVIEVTGGTKPANMNLTETPVRANPDGGIWFYFTDDDQSIDVTLSVRAMDLGGNLGDPATVRLTHSGNVGCVGDGGPGDDVDGCSAGTRSGPGTAAMVLLAMALVLYRRRAARA